LLSKFRLMNANITSILLIATAAVIFASATAFIGDASATKSSNYKSNNYQTLLNCLSNHDGPDGFADIQWFEPVGCSTDDGNGNSVEGIGAELQDSPDNAGAERINYNTGPTYNDYRDELYGNQFEDPYEVGWN
jgi:hypothetical protein